MNRYNLWNPIELKDVPAEAKILKSAWDMKNKSNGIHRARMNACGYEQVDGANYKSSNVVSPVTNFLMLRYHSWMGSLLIMRNKYTCIYSTGI